MARVVCVFVLIWLLPITFCLSLIFLLANPKKPTLSVSWQNMSPYRFENGDLGWTWQAILPTGRGNRNLSIDVTKDVKIASIFLRDTEEKYWHPHSAEYRDNSPNLYRYAEDGQAPFDPLHADIICRNLIPSRQYAVVVLLRKN